MAGPIEDASCDTRMRELSGRVVPVKPVPGAELAKRVEIEMRGSPLVDDVPVRRGREKPELW